MATATVAAKKIYYKDDKNYCYLVDKKLIKDTHYLCTNIGNTTYYSPGKLIKDLDSSDTSPKIKFKSDGTDYFVLKSKIRVRFNVTNKADTATYVYCVGYLMTLKSINVQIAYYNGATFDSSYDIKLKESLKISIYYNDDDNDTTNGLQVYVGQLNSTNSFKITELNQILAYDIVSNTNKASKQKKNCTICITDSDDNILGIAETISARQVEKNTDESIDIEITI